MEDRRVKTVGSYEEVSEIALKEIQGLDEVFDEQVVNRNVHDDVGSFSYRNPKVNIFF